VEVMLVLPHVAVLAHVPKILQHLCHYHVTNNAKTHVAEMVEEMLVLPLVAVLAHVLKNYYKQHLCH